MARDKSKKFCEQSAAVVCIKLLAEDSECPRPLPELQQSAVDILKDEDDDHPLKRNRTEWSEDSQLDRKSTTVSQISSCDPRVQETSESGSQKLSKEDIEETRENVVNHVRENLDRTENHSNEIVGLIFSKERTSSAENVNMQTSV